MDDAKLLGALATWALLWEVHAAPKPGLVDRLSSGAHDDMNYDTFLASALSLAPHWPCQATVGFEIDDPQTAMTALRERGKIMEKEMLLATGGVNTHKGLVFALSLLLWGSGRLLSLGRRPCGRAVVEKASRLVQGCVAAELEPLKGCDVERPLSHGERLYLLHGVTGIRGEAEKGFPSITTSGLPALTASLRSGSTPEEAALDALLALMATCEDSNVIHRGGHSYWRQRYLPLVDGFRLSHRRWDEKKRRHLQELDSLFRKDRISPGGAADLLACTLYLHGLNRLFKQTYWQH